jgi:hypothetical protein
MLPLRHGSRIYQLARVGRTASSQKTFPQEKEYRHSLQEEAESLRAAIKSAVDRKSLDKQFEILGRLDKEGLLEAFVLMTARDEGVAHDHPEYLKNNRRSSDCTLRIR